MGVGMMDCKFVFQVVEGDFEGVVCYFCEKGFVIVVKWVGWVVVEGVVVVWWILVGEVVLFEFNCEIDFVVKILQFVELVGQLVDVVVILV